MNIWFVIVNFNGWEDTIKCIHSLEVHNGQAQFILVDNASAEDRCEEMRHSFPWCDVIREEKNGGWAGGNNAGLRYALERNADWIVLLNNDTTVSPTIVNELKTAIERFPKYGIIGPVINHMDEPDRVMTDGCLFNRPGSPGFFDRLEVVPSKSEPLTITDVDIVNGCCLAVSREVCNKIGLVDEQFFLIHEESDFCLRAREAGFKCGVFNRSLVLHKGSSSFKRTGQRTQRYYDSRNLKLLLNKHIGKHREGRGSLASYRTYFNYLYYRYCVEVENGCTEAAEAVLDGVMDGIYGRYGQYQQQRWRLGKSIVRANFACRRWITSWLVPKRKEATTSATVVR
jgi:GT2 family glycosyltransferase